VRRGRKALPEESFGSEVLALSAWFLADGHPLGIMKGK
jgi:hypothetical protein